MSSWARRFVKSAQKKPTESRGSHKRHRAHEKGTISGASRKRREERALETIFRDAPDGVGLRHRREEVPEAAATPVQPQSRPIVIVAAELQKVSEPRRSAIQKLASHLTHGRPIEDVIERLSDVALGRTQLDDLAMQRLKTRARKAYEMAAGTADLSDVDMLRAVVGAVALQLDTTNVAQLEESRRLPAKTRLSIGRLVHASLVSPHEHAHVAALRRTPSRRISMRVEETTTSEVSVDERHFKRELVGALSSRHSAAAIGKAARALSELKNDPTKNLPELTTRAADRALIEAAVVLHNRRLVEPNVLAEVADAMCQPSGVSAKNKGAWLETRTALRSAVNHRADCVLPESFTTIKPERAASNDIGR